VPHQILGMDEARHFKFGVPIDIDEYYHAYGRTIEYSLAI